MMPAAIPWRDLALGPNRLSCPHCGRGPKDKTLGATVEAARGVAHCYRCGYVETWRDDRAIGRPARAPKAAPTAIRSVTLSDFGRRLWDACKPLRGTVSEDYLLARGCELPPEDGDLRFHPALKHPGGYVGPALVALITHLETRAPMSLHRTWIRADGTKADVSPARLLLAGHRKQGGAIRLWPDEAVADRLGVAEGIETALTLAVACRPSWSMLDAGNLGAMPVLRGISELTVCADNDPAGLQAGRACATRWAQAGRHVRLIVPPRAGMDLNDLARATA